MHMHMRLEFDGVKRAFEYARVHADRGHDRAMPKGLVTPQQKALAQKIFQKLARDIGQQKEVERALGVSQSTVSRAANGAGSPGVIFKAAALAKWDPKEVEAVFGVMIADRAGVENEIGPLPAPEAGLQMFLSTLHWRSIEFGEAETYKRALEFARDPNNTKFDGMEGRPPKAFETAFEERFDRWQKLPREKPRAATSVAKKGPKALRK
jgi:transcriptional regulator with XRE-family HTH domain